jgi:hypothetical protein
VKRHDFDPFSFVFGLVLAGLGLYFLFGNGTAADIGPTWIWPFPVLLVGLTAVMYAVRRMRLERRRVTDPDGEDRELSGEGSVDPTRVTSEPHED